MLPSIVCCNLETYLSPYFFEEHSIPGPVACNITDQRYASLQQQFVITVMSLNGSVQARWCCSTHSPLCVIGFCFHFSNDRIIHCHFPIFWSARSSDSISCDFWLWVTTKTLSCFHYTSLRRYRQHSTSSTLYSSACTVIDY